MSLDGNVAPHTIPATAVLFVLLSGIASACDALDGTVDEQQLLMQPPIMASDARRTIAYGSRRLGHRVKMQAGMTYEAAAGTPVVAVHAGRVRTVQSDMQYGNLIVVEHGAGLATLYAFLDGLDLRVGDCIRAGAIVARIGAPAGGRKPALYVEVSDDGQFVFAVRAPARE